MLTLNDLVIRPQEPLRQALERMTRNREGVLFVCDEDLHLIGLLSDGDVRRALLHDTLLVASVSKVMNMDPVTADTVEKATALLRARGLVAVPVVAADGRIKAAVVENGGDVSVLAAAASDGGSATAVESEAAIAIIPARGGSKRIPRKNLAFVGGQSLLARAIHAAKKAERVGHVLVSTDDPEIADAARACGVEVPWLRPAELARDDTPSLDVVLHALEWAVGTLIPPPAFAVLLEPTAPLRTAEHIDAALEKLAASDADAVVAVSEVPHPLNPEALAVIENGALRTYLAARTLNTMPPRAKQVPVYARNGLVYAVRTKSVLSHKTLYGEKTLPLVTGWEMFLDVDTEKDLKLADVVMRMQRDR